MYLIGYPLSETVTSVNNRCVKKRHFKRLRGAELAGLGKADLPARPSLRDIPPRLITKTAQKMGAERAAELTAFLDALQAETFDGKAM